MIERIAMALLDDHFVPRKIAYIRDVAHPRLKVFRHHAGISDDHGRGGAGRHQTGVARRGLTQFRDEFSGGDPRSSIRTQCSLPMRISSITSGLITEPPITVSVPLMLMIGVTPSSA